MKEGVKMAANRPGWFCFMILERFQHLQRSRYTPYTRFSIYVCSQFRFGLVDARAKL